MTYYLLRQDAREDHWRAMFVEGVPLATLRAGQPIEDPVNPVRVTVSAWGTERSDYLEQPCTVVSDEMRRALDQAGVNNIQYFKADVQMEYSAEIMKNYWLANVVGLVSGVDLDKSQYDPSAGSSSLGAFQINPVRAGEFNLFRLAEDRRLIVVSNRVEEFLRSAGLRGLILQDTRTYTGAPVSTALVESQV